MHLFNYTFASCTLTAIKLEQKGYKYLLSIHTTAVVAGD